MKSKKHTVEYQRAIRKENARTVANIGNDKEHLEKGPKLSEMFLLGNLSDLLYEAKYLAKTVATTRSARIKKNSIAKLKLILGRYRTVLESHFKEIISDFIGCFQKSKNRSSEFTQKCSLVVKR